MQSPYGTSHGRAAPAGGTDNGCRRRTTPVIVLGVEEETRSIPGMLQEEQREQPEQPSEGRRRAQEHPSGEWDVHPMHKKKDDDGAWGSEAMEAVVVAMEAAKVVVAEARSMCVYACMCVCVLIPANRRNYYY